MQDFKKTEAKFINHEVDLAFSFIANTNRNVFLTGKAGTGKTTFLHRIKAEIPKRMVVVAPTGVAAMNARGVTIHSFFQLSFSPFIPNGINSDKNSFKFSHEKKKIIKGLDLLVIDEISMVRADVLDGIDDVLRRFKDKYKPFGGVQLLLIGDVNQLAPVTNDDEWQILKEWYDTMYFFSSRALNITNYVSIELKHIYRQSDKVFIQLLNNIRENKLNFETLNAINKRYDPRYVSDTPEGFISLTTHNYQANKINISKLNSINTTEYSYKCDLSGDFPEYMYPTETILRLKKGAQVMFVKNDTSNERQYYNGKIGIVEKIDKDLIQVKCKGDTEDIVVSKTEWQNIKYTIDSETSEINEEVAGSFIQYPLKLAWAITIHKSQGLTFDNVIIDAKNAFAFGQVYVALSRCKTLEGIYLLSKISESSIKYDETIRIFSENVTENMPSTNDLNKSKAEFQKELILELVDFNKIKSRLRYILKLYSENIGSLHASLKTSLEVVLEIVDREFIEPSEKFKTQIIRALEQEADSEKNSWLIERIKKASIYFREKLVNNLKDGLDSVIVLSDNKTVQKLIINQLDNLKEEINLKEYCLMKVKENWSVSGYLEARAKGSIIEKSLSIKKEPQRELKYDDLVKNIVNPKLFETIKKWRSNKALESGLACSNVLQLKTMLEISKKTPVTITELKKVFGIGKGRAQNYGKEIIEIVKKYCQENNVIIPETKEETTINFNKVIKGETKNISFDMFKKGLTIDEIATGRGLTKGTIESHFIEFIKNGLVKLNEIMDEGKIRDIAKEFSENANDEIGKIKVKVGETATYSELRLVQAHIRVTNRRHG